MDKPRRLPPGAGKGFSLLPEETVVLHRFHKPNDYY